MPLGPNWKRGHPPASRAYRVQLARLELLADSAGADAQQISDFLLAEGRGHHLGEFTGDDRHVVGGAVVGPGRRRGAPASRRKVSSASDRALVTGGAS